MTVAVTEAEITRAQTAGAHAARAGRDMKTCPHSVVTERPLALAWLRGFKTGPVDVEVKAPKFGRLGVAKWDEDTHPRDREGRFIETGGQVRTTGGATGRVVRALAGGRIEIIRDGDGKRVAVHKGHLTVVKGPNGERPQGDTPTTMPASAPRFDGVDDVAAHWANGGDLDDDTLADVDVSAMALSAGGNLVAVRAGDGYDIVHAGTGLLLTRA